MSVSIQKKTIYFLLKKSYKKFNNSNFNSYKLCLILNQKIPSRKTRCLSKSSMFCHLCKVEKI